jgi:hypothetical protein
VDDMTPSYSDVRAELARLVTIANRVAFEFDGSRATCILTSFALNDVLQRLGYRSRPLRVKAAVFPDDQKAVGTILGWSNPPGGRRATKPDMWWGHWRCSSTTCGCSTRRSTRRTRRSGRDRCASARSQPGSRINSGLSTGQSWSKRASAACGSPHPRQIGFANAGDARPSHWNPLADRIFEAVQAVPG